MNGLPSLVRYCFFASYSLFITRNRKYGHIFLSITITIDKVLRFKFLKMYARKQHEAFSLKDEERILKLTGNTTLEVGSGMGYWGLLLKDYGREIVALEICDSYLRLVKMIGAYDAVIKGSVDALPIRPNYFETTLAIEVIEHVSKQKGFSLINEVKRVSKCAIITTPLDISGNEDLPDWVPESEHHLSCWTEEEFRKEGLVTTRLGKSLLAIRDGKQAA